MQVIQEDQFKLQGLGAFAQLMQHSPIPGRGQQQLLGLEQLNGLCQLADQSARVVRVFDLAINERPLFALQILCKVTHGT